VENGKCDWNITFCRKLPQLEVFFFLFRFSDIYVTGVSKEVGGVTGYDDLKFHATRFRDEEPIQLYS
jgi:hypothetical protein